MIVRPEKINLNINDISQSKVDVTFDEVLISVCNHYGLNRNALLPEMGKHWSKEEGKISYFTDTSHHGSPNYVVYREETLDDDENRILVMIDELVTLLRKRSESK